MGNHENKTKDQLLKEVDELQAKLAVFERSEKNKQAVDKNEIFSKDQLIVSEKQYRLMFKNMLNGYAYHKILLDENEMPIDYLFIDINRGFEKITSLKKEAIIGKKATQIFPLIAQDPADWIGRYGKVANQGEDIRFESYSEPLNKWFSVYAYCPEKDYFVTFFEDISSQKEADSELKKYKALHEHTEKMAKIGGWTFDVETLAQTWSDEIFRILEVDLTKGAPKVPQGLDFIDPPYRQRAEKALQRAMEHGEAYDQDWIITTSKGNKRWVNAVGNPVIDKGRTVRISGSFQDITTRINAKEALLKSEAKFRSVFENSPLGLSLTQINGSLSINRAFCEIVGYSYDELKSMSWQEITHPDDIQESKNIVQSLLDNKTERAQYQKRYLHKDGRVIWTDVITALKRDLNNEPEFFITTIRDITEKKKNEHFLAEQSQRIKGILEGTNAGTWDWNIQTGEVELNERWAEIIGHTLEELEPIDINTWINKVHPDDLPLANRELQKNFNKEINYFDVEFRQPHKDGSHRWVNARGKVVEWSDDGKPLRMSGTHLDITERKQAEEIQRNSEEKFHTFSQMSPVGIFVSDADGKTSYWNNKICEITGMSIDDAKGTGWVDGIHPDDKELVFNQWYKSKEARSNFKMEYRFVDQSGKTTWTIGQAKPLKDADGNLLGFVGSITDITEQKLIEEELKKHRGKLEELVKKRTEALEIKNKKLDDAMKAFVGREITIRNLQERIRLLEKNR